MKTTTIYVGTLRWTENIPDQFGGSAYVEYNKVVDAWSTRERANEELERMRKKKKWRCAFETITETDLELE